MAIPDTMEIPARSVMLTVQLSRVVGREGFVEPLSTTHTGTLKRILVARTLTQVTKSQNIVLEFTNISPTPTKVYKGTTLGTTFTPMGDVCVVNSVQDHEITWKHSKTVCMRLTSRRQTCHPLSFRNHWISSQLSVPSLQPQKTHLGRPVW